ncbi:uncharacterized CRM domain-containing protein At3g25440, chloroplastic-like [Zingiber officinale]|uniref:CRM domain-containing protein n=1 Tax=Zingiber officinale TaxID=94328 RepID=A0A8J5HSA6_ZINOF|nr:uncharacterized CRM domain-containing protein At3g25440, chloroplastic-like [Zingiber officinale]KAG6523864.1 hypothetical protein ZIOFF_013751 [Zingiber officinale]
MGSRAALSLSKVLQRSRHPRFLLPRSAPIPLPPSPLPLLTLTLRSHVPSLGSFDTCWGARGFSYGSANLVLPDGKPRFEIHEIDQPPKEKYRTKKRLKLQRKRDKRKRKEANKADPRRIRPKGKKKDRFPSQEDRIKYKIEKAKIKEALLIEKLRKYEIQKSQGPEIKPEDLSGEERFYLKKIAQKKSNYVPVGRRGIFGGVILNMHLHWKKHETVKVICKPCKPGQVHEYAEELERLSGGVPIQIIGKDTIIFYRGKDYVQPEVMSPIDTLSKKKALEKSKYEQSLDTVRRFISISEKELELYYRHVALYGDPNTRNADFVYGDAKGNSQFRTTKVLHSPELGNAVSTSHDSSVDSFISSTGEISSDQSDKDDF